MDFKSTIFIFGIGLIFILPLVITSPISGGIYQKTRAVDLEEAFGEEGLVRVKRVPTKQPGSKRDVAQRGKHNDKFKGGGPGDWHIHDEGSNPHIKLGPTTKFNLVKNQPETNKRIAGEALHHLDSLRSKPKNYQRLREEIVKITQTGVVE